MASIPLECTDCHTEDISVCFSLSVMFAATAVSCKGKEGRITSQSIDRRVPDLCVLSTPWPLYDSLTAPTAPVTAAGGCSPPLQTQQTAHYACMSAHSGGFSFKCGGLCRAKHVLHSTTAQNDYTTFSCLFPLSNLLKTDCLTCPPKGGVKRLRPKWLTRVGSVFQRDLEIRRSH